MHLDIGFELGLSYQIEPRHRSHVSVLHATFNVRKHQGDSTLHEHAAFAIMDMPTLSASIGTASSLAAFATVEVAVFWYFGSSIARLV